MTKREIIFSIKLLTIRILVECPSYAIEICLNLWDQMLVNLIPNKLHRT